MKPMTSRQRLLAASRHQPVDIIPVSPDLGHAVHYHCGSASPQNILRLKKIYDFDLEKAKKICGNKMTLMGHTDLIYVIQNGTTEDIRKTIAQSCAIGGKPGSFILGTSDSIREQTPIENIDA